MFICVKEYESDHHTFKNTIVCFAYLKFLNLSKKISVNVLMSFDLNIALCTIIVLHLILNITSNL